MFAFLNIDLPDLLLSLYGADYADRIEQLNETDDIFRRIYKRLTPPNAL